jgi:hypothetical protein
LPLAWIAIEQLPSRVQTDQDASDDRQSVKREISLVSNSLVGNWLVSKMTLASLWSYVRSCTSAKEFMTGIYFGQLSTEALGSSNSFRQILEHLKVAHSKCKWPVEQYFHHAQQMILIKN